MKLYKAPGKGGKPAPSLIADPGFPLIMLETQNLRFSRLLFE